MTYSYLSDGMPWLTQRLSTQNHCTNIFSPSVFFIDRNTGWWSISSFEVYNFLFLLCVTEVSLLSFIIIIIIIVTQEYLAPWL